MDNYTWAENMPVVQVRIARPTKQLEKVVAFYRDGLGLKEITRFGDHRYTGVVLGLPGKAYHLELTDDQNASEHPTPDPDSLLVLYMPDKQAIGRLVVKLGALGYFPIAPANPYWEDKGVTIADPDGWRLVLVDTNGI